MFNFENLRIYKLSLVLVDDVYAISNKFPSDELFALTNQLRRASVSICLNIAEGSSRTKKDFSHFLDLSRGSCYECVAILTIARNRKYISINDYENFYFKLNELTKMINALKTSLKK